MRRIAFWSLSLSVVLAAAALVGVAWNQRANDLCREDAPGPASGYTVGWEWSELGYVCTYRTPSAQPKRIGIIDAFHGDRGRGHRP
jgi:hypothetical protein